MNVQDAATVQKLAKRSPKEELENSFRTHWTLLFGDLPMPVRQYPIRNHATGRDWKLDFAWVEERLAVEIQGGAWTGGGHNTAKGQHSDYCRHNELTRRGWRILYFNTIACKNMAEVVTDCAEILCAAEEVIPVNRS